MTTATVVRETSQTRKRKGLANVWRCQFCAEGLHRSCPRAVRHGDVLWKCKCAEDDEHFPTPYCLTCRHDRAEDINAATWVCLDPHGCATRVQVRRENNPIWRKVRDAQVRGAVARKIKRMMQENIAVPPDEDARIEHLHDYQDQLRAARSKPQRARRSATPRASVGECECCGEVTRGGRFLPGHDAKMASELVARIRNNGDAEAYAEMVRRGWEKKVPAALRSEMATREGN